MVAIFVVLTFATFIAVDLIVFRKKWAKTLSDAPGTAEVAGDKLYNIPEVGLTMADGQPEEEDEEKNQ
ncbi:MAG: hypothetical protein GF419_07855 [Ignavibacteriales bacterium]|nr:hypothetical protein [Ignavibacteriales bacterium]